MVTGKASDLQKCELELFKLSIRGGRGDALYKSTVDIDIDISSSPTHQVR